MIFARRLVCVAISLTLALTGIFMPQTADAASGTTGPKASNYSVPGKLYIGSAVTLKGTVSSNKKLKFIRVGIKNSKKHWLVGKNVSVNPKSKKFDIRTVDTKIKFGKLKAGTYYYTVYAKDSSGSDRNVINKKFTVSEMKPMYYNTPQYYQIKGRSFDMKGKVYSKFKMTRVTIGITNSKGSWKSGFYKTVNPKSDVFNIASVDTSIKFGKLPAGTYRYAIYARDNKGKAKTILSKTFKVVTKIPTESYSESATAPVLYRSNYTMLKYNSTVIGHIGKQNFSGPCGLYCMAYCRAILDGKFSKTGYDPVKKEYREFDTYYQKLYCVYGHHSNAAYWSEAGGDCIWYSTARSSYVRAYREIKKGKPCIIKLHNGYSGNNHYVTIIGYTMGTTESNVCLDRLIAIDPVFCQVKYLEDISYYSDTSTPQCITF